MPEVIRLTLGKKTILNLTLSSDGSCSATHLLLNNAVKVGNSAPPALLLSLD